MFKGKPYVNKHIKRWDQERSMEQHMTNLHHVRPRTGTIDHDEVVINNRKKQMIKEDRFTEIERENRILLEKISSIMGKPGTSKNKILQKNTNKSLNSSVRKRQLQNIEIQNAKLLKRLQQKKSDYQTQKFRISWKRNKYMIKNLSNYPPIISDRKKRRSSSSAIGNSVLRNMHSTTFYNQKAQNLKVVQQCKIRVIDGISFLITVRLSKDTLQIIGDSRDKKDIKVIEIDKKEAAQFIEQECDGKIQNIFDRLRYDRVDQVLYLVGQNITLDELKTDQENPKNNYDNNPEFDISVQGPKEEELKQEAKESEQQSKKKYWVEQQQPQDKDIEDQNQEAEVAHQSQIQQQQKQEQEEKKQEDKGQKQDAIKQGQQQDEVEDVQEPKQEETVNDIKEDKQEDKSNQISQQKQQEKPDIPEENKDKEKSKIKQDQVPQQEQIIEQGNKQNPDESKQQRLEQMSIQIKNQSGSENKIEDEVVVEEEVEDNQKSKQ